MERFAWNGLPQNVREWTSCFIPCQTTKVHQPTTKAPIVNFDAPDGRFHHVHIDLVGPLSPSRGHRFLLTCVGRFTRWCEDIPLIDSHKETVMLAFLQNWIARFGAQRSLTTDRAPQFESTPFIKLCEFLGCERILRIAYHPAAKGMVERSYRQLKATLMSHANREQCEIICPSFTSVSNRLPRPMLTLARPNLATGPHSGYPGTK